MYEIFFPLFLSLVCIKNDFNLQTRKKHFQTSFFSSKYALFANEIVSRSAQPSRHMTFSCDVTCVYTKLRHEYLARSKLGPRPRDNFDCKIALFRAQKFRFKDVSAPIKS